MARLYKCATGWGVDYTDSRHRCDGPLDARARGAREWVPAGPRAADVHANAPAGRMEDGRLREGPLPSPLRGRLSRLRALRLRRDPYHRGSARGRVARLGRVRTPGALRLGARDHLGLPSPRVRRLRRGREGPARAHPPGARGQTMGHRRVPGGHGRRVSAAVPGGGLADFMGYRAGRGVPALGAARRAAPRASELRPAPCPSRCPG